MPVERLCRLAVEFDSLLRHRLLLKPHGFDGCLNVEIAHDRADDFAVLDLEGIRLPNINGNIAVLAGADPARVADDPRIGVDVLVDLGSELVVNVRPQARDTPDTGKAVED